MKEMLRYGFILALICVIASGLLAVVNAVTRIKIVAQAQAEEEGGLKEIFPKATHFEPVKSGRDVAYYKAYTKDAEFIGVAFKASGKGYSSTIDTLAGVDKYGRLTTIKILSQNETPGLGARVAEPLFIKQFSNKTIHGLLRVQAITGATISSKAVIDSVRKKAEEVRGMVQELKGTIKDEE